jgi:DNA-binding protein H-NS
MEGSQMAIELERMSLKDLRDLQGRVARAISTFEERKKQEAIAELEQRAREMGFNLAELLAASSGRKRKPAKVKYRNPDNTDETWTGRGRRPRWIDAALKGGKSLDDLLA